MRKIILLPLKFILFFIISCGILIFFTLIFNWGHWFSPSLDIRNSLFLYLPAAAGTIIIPSVSSALLFSVFDYREEKLHFISVILLSAVLLGTVLFGMRVSASMSPAGPQQSFQPFSSKTLHFLENSIVYTDETGAAAPANVTGIVIRSRENNIPGFKFYHSGRVTDRPSALLNIDSGISADIVPHNPVFDTVFRPPGLLSGYFRDISFFNGALLEKAGSGGLEFILFSAAFSGFLIICLLFRGATVWPLLDIIIILFFHRLVFYIFKIFSTESGFIAGTFFDGNFSSRIPLFSLAGMSAVLFFAGILLKTLKPKRKS